MELIMNIFVAAVLAGTPLLFGTLGEILTEKSGNLNLGVEGMMFMGAIGGLAAPYYYEKAVVASGGNVSGILAIVIATIASFLTGAIGATIYSFLTITLRANQNVTGLALTIFGVGVGNFFGEFIGLREGGYAAVGGTIKKAFGNVSIPVLSDIPVLGKVLFSYNWMVYFALALAIVMTLVFKKTRVGLHLIAVGENPATADAAGINVTKYRYLATIIGGGICGLGGMYMSMITTSGVWVHNCVSGYGWLAVALVIFAAWSPARAILAAVVFGGLTILRLYVGIPGLAMQLYDMLPYVATIIVLIANSIRQSKENVQPTSCGINYMREER